MLSEGSPDEDPVRSGFLGCRCYCTVHCIVHPSNTLRMAASAVISTHLLGYWMHMPWRSTAAAIRNPTGLLACIRRALPASPARGLSGIPLSWSLGSRLQH